MIHFVSVQFFFVCIQKCNSKDWSEVLLVNTQAQSRESLASPCNLHSTSPLLSSTMVILVHIWYSWRPVCWLEIVILLKSKSWKEGNATINISLPSPLSDLPPDLPPTHRSLALILHFLHLIASPGWASYQGLLVLFHCYFPMQHMSKVKLGKVAKVSSCPNSPSLSPPCQA